MNAVKVLIVDDSVVFRTAISRALSKVPEIAVVGTAAHGKIALQRLELHPADVMTLDMEMPEMSGLEVLREMRRRGYSTKVIVFSSQTQRGAELALHALKEGADDVVAKPFSEGLSFETAEEAIRTAIIPKILQFSATPSISPTQSIDLKSQHRSISIQQDIAKMVPSVIVIGSSTGGPNALEKVFAALSTPTRIPILVVQHMPPVFTEMLAKRISEVSAVPAREAKSGERLMSNRVYVAPGDYHLSLRGSPEDAHIFLHQGPQRNSVRPAVDVLFEDAAEIYGSSCLGIVLTGMGEDGLVGARRIRARGGAILIQDKASSVVFGMPGAIFAANEFDRMGDLQEISRILVKASAAR